MATALVTGGAGFIGSHVATNLLANGVDVVVLDDLSGGMADQVPRDARFVEGSILDVALIEDLFGECHFDYVYHLAAYAAEGLSHFIRGFNYTNNVVGSMNLINAAVNFDVTCFVFTSSIAVYGAAPVPMTEDMRPSPEDPYGIAKFAVEMDLKAAHEMFGLDYVIFRPHNVYGEHQNIGDRYRNVIGIFMNQILQGRPMTVFGNGEQTRAFSHIDDVAPIIARSIERSACYNQVFNVGAEIPYSINTLAHTVAHALGVTPQIQYLEARKEVVQAFSDHTKARRYFNDLTRNVSLEQGIHGMATWVKALPARQMSKFEGIEVLKNLPPSWLKP